MPASRLLRPFGAALAITLAGGLASTALGPSAAHAARPTAQPSAFSVNLVVLVVDDGEGRVGPILERLRQQGVPTRVVSLQDPTRPVIDAAFLRSTDRTGPVANFSGVVMPQDVPTGLTSAERQALNDFESAFGIREFDAYNWAYPGVGVDYSWNGYEGSLDGTAATLTPAATSGAFSYLDGPLPFDDKTSARAESWGYLTAPAAGLPAGTSFTPYLTAKIPGTTTTGVLLGVYTQGKREQLVSTFGASSTEQQFRALAPGIVDWVTRGIATSFWRNYFSIHADDTFLKDAEWSVNGKCTIGVSCDPTLYPSTAPGATSRMTPADVTYLKDWQNRTGLKIDQAFNGLGSDSYASANGSDPLLAAFAASASSFRFINHTYDHTTMGCLRDYTVTPWQCQKDANGAILYRSQADIQDSISKNLTWAANHGIPTNKAELVTGEHSGLRTLPQQPVDNPNLGPVLTSLGITSIGSDASRESTTRMVGPALAVPRYPLAIAYDTSTKASMTSRYNWTYTSAADGGAGTCGTSCIAPLDPATGFDSYIAPREADGLLLHTTTNDPRPHYVHQSNLTNDRIIYPVIDTMLTRYNATYAASTPIVDPTQTEAGIALRNQEAWAAASKGVTARLTGSTITVTNTTGATVTVPVTMPAGTTKGSGKTTAFGQSYAGRLSEWAAVPAASSVSYKLSGASGYTAP